MPTRMCYCLATLGAVCALAGELRADKGAIRVVPQLGWEQKGRVSPNGDLGACIYVPFAVRVVDLRKACLAWNIRADGMRDLAFSADGNHLAACGWHDGFIMDLRTEVVRRLDILAGSAIAFSADSGRLLIASPKGRFRGPYVLRVLNLQAEILNEYPFEMARADVIEELDHAKSVKILGVDGCVGCVVEYTWPAEQIIELREGERIVAKKPSSRRALLSFRDRFPTTARSATAPSRRSAPNLREASLTLLPPPNARKAVLFRTSTFDVDERSPTPSAAAGLTVHHPGYHEKFSNFHWDEGSGICVVSGVKGRGVTVWDIKRGAYVTSQAWPSGICEISGFIKPGLLMTSRWHEESFQSKQPAVRRLVLIDPATGAFTVTGVPGDRYIRYIASGDGHHVAGVVRESRGGRPLWLELWDINGKIPIAVATYAANRQGVEWIANGTRLAWIGFDSRREQCFVEVRHFDKPPECFYLPEQTGDNGSTSATGARHEARGTYRSGSQDPETIWSFACDKDFRRLALGVGHSKAGKVMVMDTATRECVAVLGGFSGCVEVVRFLDDDRILAGDLHGVVKLWNIATDKILWSTDTRRSGVTRLDYTSGGPFIVCQHHGPSAAILDVDDGSVLRMISGIHHSGGGNPQLIAHGETALEVEPEGLRVHLVKPDTGKKLLSFFALPDDQWIVYTPEGYWFSSEQLTPEGFWSFQHIHDRVRFYRGSELLDATEANRFRQRDKVDRVLRRVFDSSEHGG